MFVYLIIGAPRQGKSSYTKAMITRPDTIKKPCYVFDPRNEYGDTYNTLINDKVVSVPGVGLIANHPEYYRSRYIGDENGVDQEYFKAVAKKKKGSNIIFEEATGFLRGMLPKDMNDILTGRFHTQNNFMLIFHSLETIPPDIIRNNSCNYIILFKTLDSLKFIERKFNNPYLTEGLRRQKLKGQGAPPTVIEMISGKIDGVNFDPE